MRTGRGALGKEMEALVEAAGLSGSSFDVFLVGNNEMERIKARLSGLSHISGHETWRKKGETCTGVLSFPEPDAFPHPEREGVFLGEVYLNKDMFKGDADGLKKHLVHGFLHLLGYRHDGSRDTIKMERKEQDLFRAIKDL